MKLCFDATKFGCGLHGAVEIAQAREVPLVEYSFAPFTAAKSQKQDDKENRYFEEVSGQAAAANVEFALLNLDYALDPGNKKSLKQFTPMLTKLAAVARTLNCKKVSFHLLPTASVVEDFAALYPTLLEALAPYDVSLLVRLSTPQEFRGVSLKQWRPLEPGEWRALLSSCDGLSFVYSPGDCLWLGIDYLQNLGHFAQAVAHVVAHDVEINRALLTDSGMYGPLWWRYRQVGKGQVDWRQIIELLKLHDFQGAFSLQFDDEFLADDPDALDMALSENVKFISPLIKW